MQSVQKGDITSRVSPTRYALASIAMKASESCQIVAHEDIPG